MRKKPSYITLLCPWCYVDWEEDFNVANWGGVGGKPMHVDSAWSFHLFLTQLLCLEQLWHRQAGHQQVQFICLPYSCQKHEHSVMFLEVSQAAKSYVLEEQTHLSNFKHGSNYCFKVCFFLFLKKNPWQGQSVVVYSCGVPFQDAAGRN